MLYTPGKNFILKCSCGKELNLKDYWEQKEFSIYADYEGNITIECSCGNEIML